MVVRRQYEAERPATGEGIAERVTPLPGQSSKSRAEPEHSVGMAAEHNKKPGWQAGFFS